MHDEAIQPPATCYTNVLNVGDRILKRLSYYFLQHCEKLIFKLASTGIVRTVHPHELINVLKGCFTATELCDDVASCDERYHVNNTITEDGNIMKVNFCVMHQVQMLALQ